MTLPSLGNSKELKGHWYLSMTYTTCKKKHFSSLGNWWHWHFSVDVILHISWVKHLYVICWVWLILFWNSILKLQILLKISIKEFKYFWLIHKRDRGNPLLGMRHGKFWGEMFLLGGRNLTGSDLDHSNLYQS